MSNLNAYDHAGLGSNPQNADPSTGYNEQIKIRNSIGDHMMDNSRASYQNMPMMDDSPMQDNLGMSKESYR